MCEWEPGDVQGDAVVAEVGRLAAGKLRMAGLRLANDYPLHARVLARLRKAPSTATDSLGLKPRGHGIMLEYNPEYVRGLSMDECCGLLLHVVNHVIFDHLGMAADEFEDADALLIAQEVTANEWVKELLPHDAITLRDYPELPPGEDTPTRYGRLCSANPKVHGQDGEPNLSGRSRGSGNDDAQQGLSRGGEGADDGHGASACGVAGAMVSAGSPNATPTPSGEQDGGAQPEQHGRRSEPRSIDDHSGWHDVAGSISAAVVRHTLLDAVNDLTESDAEQLDPVLRNIVKQLGRGTAPGSMAETLRPLEGSVLPWPVLLRRFLRVIGEPELSFNRPPRRLPRLVGIVPGKRRLPNRARVMAAIDTSGSMGQEDLNRIAAELRRLARTADIVVVQCDAAIHSVEDFSGRLTKVLGRGGTDLRPPFEPIVLRKARPSVVVYFTDGLGPAPPSPPRVPVIWCITPGGKEPASWGLVARMIEG